MLNNDLKIWQALESYNYEAKSGLDYINEFTFLVAILLSAQAQDKFINTQTKEFFQKASNANKMLNLGIQGIMDYINRISLWKNKAKNIYKLASQIIELKKINESGNAKNWYDDICAQHTHDEYNDLTLYGPPISKEGLPSFRLGLLQLAGIGRKSANVFLNVVYNAPVFAVDTHVARVGQRLGLIEGNNPFQLEKMMVEVVPKKYEKVACHWLVWHGRNVCNAKKPKCGECKLKEYCNYVKKL
jgi:endonuclease-3